MTSVHASVPDLCDASTFARDFFTFANAEPPPSGEARLATDWFEKLMLGIAEKHGVYCQNRQHHSEWMKVDHVFVRKTKTYADFPLVAVEHENRGLSKASQAGRVPDGSAADAFIEWAAWKALTMRARLHVLVAYPWKKHEQNALATLALMVDGYRSTFGELPNALFLLGWWSSSMPVEWKAEGLYAPYFVVETAENRCVLAPLML